jgi:hypothetical protein
MDKFWVVRDGERVGPFDESEILRSYESGALRADDLLVGEDGGVGARIGEVFDQLRRDILTSPDLTLDDFEPAPAAAPPEPERSVEPARPPEVPPAPRRWTIIALVAALAVVAGLVLVFLA